MVDDTNSNAVIEVAYNICFLSLHYRILLTQLQQRYMESLSCRIPPEEKIDHQNATVSRGAHFIHRMNTLQTV